jgi:DNA modification methylase
MTAGVLDQTVSERFALYHGDCVEVMRGLPRASVDYSVFSPPFASLYTHSNSPHDLGNVRTYEEFFDHFAFVVAELRRVMKPGRNVSFHCMVIPTSKERDGYIGMRDFRGDLIRAFQAGGFVHHAEVVIWKDPVTQMQRTKALGLLHKTVRENAAMSRMGLPDYLITMRAPGDAPERVKHDPAQFPVSRWQKVASPVWMDIDPSDTLQYRSAREDEDERHICPLQLEVIRRGVDLWTNPGEVVLSPFAGIGSEGVVSVEMGRRFVGAELKASYYRQAAANLTEAEKTGRPATLFGDGGADGTPGKAVA